MEVSELMQGSQLQFVPMIMIHYIALSHLVGGVYGKAIPFNLCDEHLASFDSLSKCERGGKKYR
jgi:hypothetical protein